MYRIIHAIVAATTAGSWLRCNVARAEKGVKHKKMSIMSLMSV